MQEITTFLSHHPLLSAMTGLVLILLVIIELFRAKRQSIAMTPGQTTQLINKDHAIVLDLRTPELYRQGHIINAQLFSAKELETTQKLDKWKNKPLILVCKKGLEAHKLAAQLIKRGYNAYSLAGGIDAWVAAGMPIVKE